ncbi:SWI/SNF and RSC complex subunit Ssr1 [Schizosaccharomyces cryophilus OY26]|uniref:SWI/SNF and RSC complex subunit Ssr1 n=1 Tax=Schizosaccharomyces cryophilus (strain OY26 / ATCC MYA-4695 / CBS 11777 / NBRC 106824 / NRRL Y48691) TaxID=653667 RepID=S9VYP4_SCHCR|nr:SWI/SNF and RSC complex subunit Ssr1 [Schizosaccharomyces cryophilus OY26]EPY52783.1 SWI/SNF and RSC complex subunit Ssr1 [Schizosaccharomyces cryophilus OY26]
MTEPVQPSTDSNVPMDIDEEKIELADNEPKDEAKEFLLSQLPPVEVPEWAQWFDFNNIHEIERNGNPEFFDNKNSSKIPQVYKEYRDFMICAFRLNPKVYLTFTACRRNLAGDVCAVLRVHRFLEQWGLINYNVDPSTRPSKIGPPSTSHFQVLADTPRGLAPLAPPPPPSIPRTQPYNLQPSILRKNIYDSEVEEALKGNAPRPSPAAIESQNVEKKEETSPTHCYSCGGILGGTYYTSDSDLSYSLCSTCYDQERFPPPTTPQNYKKIESSSKKDDAHWSSQEMLLLFEGLDMFPDDWSKISSHVGTKSIEQCILKFLNLPSTDKELFQSSSASYPGVRSLQDKNPILSVVTLLAKMVTPSSLKFSQPIEEGNDLNKETKDQTLSSIKTEGMDIDSACYDIPEVYFSDEEKRMSSTMKEAIDTQLKLIDSKLTHFDYLDQHVRVKSQELDSFAQETYKEKLFMKRECIAAKKKIEQRLHSKDSSSNASPFQSSTATPTILPMQSSSDCEEHLFLFYFYLLYEWELSTC